MNNLIKTVILSFFILGSFLLFGIGKAWAASYYVDNNCANNGDGSMQSCAASPGAAGVFNSLAYMDAKVGGYSPGDYVYLKKGDMFREQLLFPSSGTSGNPITVGSESSFGSGANPVVNGSVVALNASFTKTGGQTIVYQIPWSIPANIQAGGMVWENNTRLTMQTSIANVNANPGSFYYDGSTTMYVSASDSSNIITNGKTYELPSLTDNVVVFPQNYVTFNAIDSIKTWGSDSTFGGYKVEGIGDIIQNVNSYNHRRHPVCVLDCTNCIVQNNNLSDSANTFAVSVFKADDAMASTGNIVRNNTLHDSYGLMIIHGADSGHIVQNTTAEFNTLYNSTAASNMAINWYNANGVTFGPGNYGYGTIGSSSNFIYGLSPTTNTFVEGNLFNLANFPTNADPLIFSGTTGVQVLNNTFVGSNSRTAIRFISGSTGAVVKNNIAYNGYRFMQFDTASQPGFLTDNNDGYGLTFWGRINSTDYTTLANWQTILGGCPGVGFNCHSITTNPDFVNPVSDFHLQNTSPAIDAGDNSVAFGKFNLTDFEGNKITDAGSGLVAPCGKIDIGAYEYQKSCMISRSAALDRVLALFRELIPL